MKLNSVTLFEMHTERYISKLRRLDNYLLEKSGLHNLLEATQVYLTIYREFQSSCTSFLDINS